MIFLLPVHALRPILSARRCAQHGSMLWHNPVSYARGGAEKEEMNNPLGRYASPFLVLLVS